MSDEKCSECGKSIEVMAFRRTGVCGENCRKERDHETDRPNSQVDAGITNILRQPNGTVRPDTIK